MLDVEPEAGATCGARRWRYLLISTLMLPFDLDTGAGGWCYMWSPTLALNVDLDADATF